MRDKKPNCKQGRFAIQRILAGSNFTSLASAFSNDIISAASGGTMQDIRVGEYDPVFENALWSLRKDGDVSSPSDRAWLAYRKKNFCKPVVLDPADKPPAELEQRSWPIAGGALHVTLFITR